MSDPEKPAEILFRIRLDEDRIPVGIEWSATDAPEGPRETKSVLLSVWNADEKKAMSIELWTKSMQVDEMQLFIFQALWMLADTLERATSEREMAQEMRRLADRFAAKLGIERSPE